MGECLRRTSVFRLAHRVDATVAPSRRLLRLNALSARAGWPYARLDRDPRGVLRNRRATCRRYGALGHVRLPRPLGPLAVGRTPRRPRQVAWVASASYPVASTAARTGGAAAGGAGTVAVGGPWASFVPAAGAPSGGW